MKVLAIVLLCAFATVQGRSAVKVIEMEEVKKIPTTNSSTDVALESKPWLVHLRCAISTSGFLQTVLGSLISPRWALTVSDIEDVRFIWIRFDVKQVSNPGLVFESSTVQVWGNYGLVNFNRELDISDRIAPISLVLSSGAINGVSCGFSDSETGGPGENLQCSEIAVEESEDGKLVGPRGSLSQFDVGTALVNNDGLQSGVLISVDGPDAIFAVITRDDADWITRETGVIPVPQPDSSESNSASSESEEDSRVKFVNF